MSDKHSLLANADGSDDDDNTNNNNNNNNKNINNNDGSEGSSGDLPPAPIARPQHQGVGNGTARAVGANRADDERFTLSELMARDGGNVRDADARAMASMRQEREKAQHDEETLEEHADMVLTIMKPVSLTM
jgi:hypothetical protein